MPLTLFCWPLNLECFSAGHFLLIHQGLQEEVLRNPVLQRTLLVSHVPSRLSSSASIS